MPAAHPRRSIFSCQMEPGTKTISSTWHICGREPMCCFIGNSSLTGLSEEESCGQGACVKLRPRDKNREIRVIGALSELSIDTIRGEAVRTAQSSFAPTPFPTRMIEVSVVTVPQRRSAAKPVERPVRGSTADRSAGAAGP